MPDEKVDILQEAQDNLTLAELWEREIRDEAKRCNKFRALEQWSEEDKAARGGRVTVVIDQLGQYVDQVVNDWRRNRLGVKVSPGDGGDPETARIIDGIIRELEHRSKAHTAYDHAFECMAWGNRGFVQVTTKRKKGSFKKELAILKIANPECVYIDPFAEEPLLKRWVIKTQVVNRKQFKKDYPNAKVVDFADAAQRNPSWFPNSESLILCEYWRLFETPRKIQKLTKLFTVKRNGRFIDTDVVYDDEYSPEDLQAKGIEVAIGPNGQRMEDDEPKREVVQYIINGAEILDETPWEGSYIPIIEWEGKEIWVEGKRKLFSLVSRSLDAQKGLNYTYSSMFERLGQAVRSPIVGFVGQFKTQRAAWEASATKPVAFLEIDPVSIGDKPAPLPQRADFDPRIDQTVTASQIIKDAIRGTIGINTAILGQDTGKAKSGVAIKELQQEGDNATFDFLDNGGRSLELVGCIVLDLIPKIYTSADLVQIRDEQQKSITIAINQDIQQMQNPPEDQQRNYYLTEGEYHVTISAAPTHESLRKEGETRMTEMLQYLAPEDAKAAIPVILRLSDFYGARELADKMDPPQKGPKIPPQIIQQIQMMSKVIEAQTKEINDLNTEKEAKVLDLMSQEKQKALDALAKIRIAEITASKDADKQGADILARQLEQLLSQAHDVGMAAMGHQQTLEQGEQGHQQAMEQAEQGNVHAQDQAEQAAELAPAPEAGGGGE